MNLQKNPQNWPLVTEIHKQLTKVLLYFDLFKNSMEIILKGFIVSFGLIVSIGAQNAFLLKQGII